MLLLKILVFLIMLVLIDALVITYYLVKYEIDAEDIGKYMYQYGAMLRLFCRCKCIRNDLISMMLAIMLALIMAIPAMEEYVKYNGLK